jgi:hypothetical protein
VDQRPLVTEQIEAGAEFLDRLAECLPISAAFWLKTDEGERWHLYIVSDRIKDGASMAGYAEVAQVQREMDNPYVDLFRVRLIGSDDPLAQAAFAMHRRFAGKGPAHLYGIPFGRATVEGVYVYPPLPQGAEAKKWRGISVNVWPEPGPEGAYRVEFWPREPAARSASGGEARRVPRPASVLVKEGRVCDYWPPEKGLPHLTEQDFKQKAVEAVQEVARAG